MAPEAQRAARREIDREATA